MKHKIFLWLPYLEKIEEIGKNKLRFTYNGGTEECSIDEINSIMIQGTEINIPMNIIDRLCSNGIIILLQRTNITSTVWISSYLRPSEIDLLDLQLEFRRNSTKCKYIARRLLEEKFKAMKWLIPIPDSFKIKKGMSIDEMRNIEAKVSKKYWKAYMDSLGVTDHRRTEDSDIRIALDIASKYVAGILLRWINYHHLSPYHGFCHTPVNYPSLVYDLIEPYRAGIERVVWQIFKDGIIQDKKQMTGVVINALKEYQNQKVYTSSTRQIITRHELYHGVILSLRSYLMGDSKKFIVPIEEVPNGGRPKRVNFKLYGRSAGKTDFWKVAKAL